MKTFRLLPLLMVLLAIPILLANCKKEDDDDMTNNTENRTLTAVVDGVNWQSADDGPHSTIGVVANLNTSLNITVTAYTTDGSAILLNVVSLSSISEGTAYNSGSGAFQAQYKPDFLGADSYSSLLGSGTITFTNISSDNVEGTFSFNGVHPLLGNVTVNNGQFNVDM